MLATPGTRPISCRSVSLIVPLRMSLPFSATVKSAFPTFRIDVAASWRLAVSTPSASTAPTPMATATPVSAERSLRDQMFCAMSPKRTRHSFFRYAQDPSPWVWLLTAEPQRGCPIQRGESVVRTPADQLRSRDWVAKPISECANNAAPGSSTHQPMARPAKVRAVPMPTPTGHTLVWGRYKP